MMERKEDYGRNPENTPVKELGKPGWLAHLVLGWMRQEVHHEFNSLRHRVRRAWVRG